MSEPVTNVQMEDVLSSIRRLVSEEIGQSGLRPLERKKPRDEDVALVLSPAQKIRQDAAEQGEDLWDETAELAPKAPAPLWWHRDFSSDAPDAQAEAAPAPAEAPETGAFNPFSPPDAPEEADTAEPIAEAPANDDPLPEFKSRLGGAIADLEAAMSDAEDDWEPEEGDMLENPDMEFDEMPWSGAVEVEDIVGDEFLERETLSAQSGDDVLTSDPLGEPAAEHLEDPAEQSAEMPLLEDEEDMIAALLPEAPDEPDEAAEAVDAAADTPDPVHQVAAAEVEEITDIPFAFHPGERLYERLGRGAKSKAADFEAAHDEAEAFAAQPEPEILTADFADQVEEQGLVLDEAMLRDMVHDIVRQELQGVLGERITRNVRKLVRREIQRAFSEVGQ